MNNVRIFHYIYIYKYNNLGFIFSIMNVPFKNSCNVCNVCNVLFPIFRRAFAQNKLCSFMECSRGACRVRSAAGEDSFNISKGANVNKKTRAELLDFALFVVVYLQCHDKRCSLKCWIAIMIKNPLHGGCSGFG